MSSFRDAIAQARRCLAAAGNPDAYFDALCLAEKVFRLEKTRLRLAWQQTVPSPQMEAYQSLIERRAAGEPLQYLLGGWEFYSLPFAVGEGVLIPRPETELLVDLAREFLAEQAAAVVFDLCAGSGCVGLSIARHCPEARILLMELSPRAICCCKKNKASLAAENATVMPLDITQPPPGTLPRPRLIVSNPPYIRSAEIGGLGKELQWEPRLALDGGADGLRFYRALARHWLRLLPPGGLLAAECGEGQAEEITALFRASGCECGCLKDMNGIRRVVTARKSA
ncbi:MAG: peptide chain release factor N(5)-glutamine methyltransferase [Oscillospiraceae bacterium]|jgi:release factor glutamine methyltransferase|nr:peptide chain release factor N(5)-glutamine methyltransferase [Oscillospiraceae bacterium]